MVEHLIVWEFQVRSGCEAQFEQAYGPRGSWAALFSTDSGYLGTELYRSQKVPGRYCTLDRWRSEDDFLRFHTAHKTEYVALDQACAAWTEAEERKGSWESVEPPGAA